MPAAIRAFTLAVFLTLVLTAPAYGALATPTPTAPANGLSVDALPAFSWAAVAGADRYEFQFAADSGMNSPVLGRGDDQFTTRNTRATLKKTIPNGSYYWRVRAIAKDGTPSSWTAPRLLVKAWTSAPQLQSPTQGAIMVHPTHPLVLRWAPVPRAAKYIVTIGTDPSLGTAVQLPVETSGTVLTPRSLLLPPGTYYWGVTPVDAQNHRGAPSAVQSFMWTWPTSTLTQVSDLFADPEVFDPHFSWDPVAGAARYEVEVNSSVDFAPGSKVCCSNAVIGTSLSPTQVFKDNTYYWRVRALDASGNSGVWNSGPAFTKTFNKVPPTPGTSVKNLRMRDNLADPGTDADTGTAGYQTNVPVMRWDPVPGAASYEVDVTPYTSGVCDWAADSSVHWRVKTSVPFWSPLGAGWVNVKPYSDPLAVSYDATTDLTAGWSYCARVRARSDRDTNNNDVYGDYTYLDDGTGKAFTFLNYPDAPRECANCSYMQNSSYELPLTGAMNGRTPFFSWQPLPRRPKKTLLNTSVAEALTITDLSVSLESSGETTWTVTTRNNSGNSAQDQIELSRTLPTPGTWTYTYTDGDLNTVAAAIEADPAHNLDVEVHVNGTPLSFLTNAPFTAGRQSYYVLVSKDASFSNIVDYAFTQLPVYAPRSLLKPTTYSDETTSYYWAVLPAIRHNGSLSTGNPLLAAPDSFQKQSTPPGLLSPASGSLVDLQPTFRWTPVEGFRRFRIQVAEDPTFGASSIVDDVVTDATAYTSNTSYPADTLLYWRVRADDENLIGLTWSTTATFQRRLPAPVPSSTNPLAGEMIPLWTWAPITGASSYDLQVDEPDGDHTEFADFRSASATFIKMTGTGKWGWRVRAQFPKPLGTQTQPGAWSPTTPFTRSISEPGAAKTEVSGTSVLLSWNAKNGAKNYRVQISQRADFQVSLEQVDTDNTAYAPLLTSPTYMAGGSFWWRVAAMDEDRNIGDFSAAQKFDLPKTQTGQTALTRLNLKLKLVKTKKGRRVTVTVRANGRLRSGVLVRVFATGVSPTKAKTNRKGQATFRLRKLGKGKRLMRRQLLFHAAKPGFLPASKTMRVNY
jgi:hypothetical protein